MATQFKMPQLGETVVEGTITRWLKKDGDAVETDEPLVEVSTDKVDSELPAPAPGTLKILAQEGETVQVGSVLAEIGEGAASSAAEAKPSEAEEAASSETPPQPEEPERRVPAAEQEVKGPQSADADGGPTAGPASIEGSQDEPRRGILSPLVRKLAAEHNVDLSGVRGTGTGGRITKQDVLDLVESGGAKQAPAAVPQQSKAPAASAGTAPAGTASPETAPAQAPPSRPTSRGEEVVQVSNMRKAIAEHMVSSLHETARAWNAVEVDMTAIGRLRKLAGPQFKQKEGFSLTWMPFLCKAVAQTLQKYPQVNSTWNGDGTITRKHYANLGIAVALENGLIVPVIRGADGMSIVGLARAVRDVAVRARSKKLMPDDVAGGTFTITNPGPFGSVMSVPIINKGQAGILAFDAVVKRPVVMTDENGSDSIAIREMVFLSMSWDHRVIDGAEAAQFLASLRESLEAADFDSDLSGYLPEGS